MSVQQEEPRAIPTEGKDGDAINHPPNTSRNWAIQTRAALIQTRKALQEQIRAVGMQIAAIEKEYGIGEDLKTN
jgi:hypothetical protein